MEAGQTTGEEELGNQKASEVGQSLEVDILRDVHVHVHAGRRGLLATLLLDQMERSVEGGRAEEGQRLERTWGGRAACPFPQEGKELFIVSNMQEEDGVAVHLRGPLDMTDVEMLTAFEWT